MRMAVLQHVEFEGPAAVAVWAAGGGFPLRVFHLYRDTALPPLSDFDMPVKWRKAVGQPIEERVGSGRPLDGKPADFFGPSRIDPRAQSFGYHLGTEVNSKHGLVRGYGLASQRDLRTKPAETTFDPLLSRRGPAARRHLRIRHH